MGCVWKARQRQFERDVAIKMLSDEMPDDPESRARFEREAVALSSLKHKNIVMFYGYGVWRGAPYMVMEHINGISLQRVLSKNNPLDPLLSLRIVSQICEALICAHANGFVHRDLKPSNIMLVGDGKSFTVKIIDFGLTRLLPSFGRGDQKLTEAGNAVGSLLYMSPEQCTGNQTDERSDIYAVGCILHHCLTGVQPFDGDHSVVVMQKHLSEPTPRLPSIGTANMDLTSVLQSVIDRAAAKDPDERYQDAQEMLRDVQTILSQDPDAISSNIRGLNLFSGSKRDSTAAAPTGKKSLVPLICAVAAILVLVGGTFYVATTKADKTETQEAEDRTVNPNLLLTEAGRLSREGNALVATRVLEKTIQSDRRTQILSKPSRVLAYTLLAQSYQSQNHANEARAIAAEGLALCESEYAVRNSTIADLAEGYARLCDSHGESAKATEQYRLAVQVAEKGPSDNLAKWRLRLMARLLHDDQIAESLAMANKIIADYPNQPYIRLIAKLHIATVMTKKGPPAQSLRAHEDAFAFEKQYRDDLPDPRANYLMGRSYMEVHQPEKAEEFFQRYEDMGPPADALLDSARCFNFAMMGRPKKSMRYARQCADILLSRNTIVEPGVLMADLNAASVILTKRGEASAAEEVKAQAKRMLAMVEQNRQSRAERGQELENTLLKVKETGL